MLAVGIFGGKERIMEEETMEENKNLPEQEELELELPEIPEVEEEVVGELPVGRILFVMAIVAVICGGNGAGIIAAGLFWKTTQNLVGAIAIAAGATLMALLIVAVIALVHKKNVKKKLEQGDRK